jgi:hypothetical protein
LSSTISHALPLPAVDEKTAALCCYGTTGICSHLEQRDAVVAFERMVRGDSVLNSQNAQS